MQFIIEMLVSWLEKHKGAADKIAHIRPYLVELEAVLSDVLEATPPAVGNGAGAG